jgi:hypothetical protein
MSVVALAPPWPPPGPTGSPPEGCSQAPCARSSDGRAGRGGRPYCNACNPTSILRAAAEAHRERKRSRGQVAGCSARHCPVSQVLVRKMRQSVSHNGYEMKASLLPRGEAARKVRADGLQRRTALLARKCVSRGGGSVWGIVDETNAPAHPQATPGHLVVPLGPPTFLATVSRSTSSSTRQPPPIPPPIADRISGTATARSAVRPAKHWAFTGSAFWSGLRSSHRVRRYGPGPQTDRASRVPRRRSPPRRPRARRRWLDGKGGRLARPFG